MKNTTKAKATSSLLPMSWENIHPLPRFYLSKWRFNLTMEVPHSIECTFPDSRTSWEKIVNWSQARLDPHSLVLSGGNNESESRDKNGPRHWFNNNNIVQQKNKFAATPTIIWTWAPWWLSGHPTRLRTSVNCTGPWDASLSLAQA